MFANAIGELELSDSSIFKKLVDLNDCRVTSKGLQLKLTEESIESLIEFGAIGLPSKVDSAQGANSLENVPVLAQKTKKSCPKSSVSCLQETVIGEIELSDLSSLNKLLNLNDCRVTSKGLGLKLTDDNIKALIESGVIGIPSNIHSDMNGLPDFNNSTNTSNVTRKGRPRNLKMPCTVVERKHQTRKHRDVTFASSSQVNAECSTEESSKLEKQPVKHCESTSSPSSQNKAGNSRQQPSRQEKQLVRNKTPPEIPVKRATRSTRIRHGKRLAACKSSEDEDNEESPSKVSVTIGMVEIKSPLSQSQASKPNNKENTRNALKVATKDDLICDTDDFKTTSESEPSDNSLKRKLSKNLKVSFKTNSPNKDLERTLPKTKAARLSSSEVSEEENIAALAEHSRTNHSPPKFMRTGGNIQSILQRYNLKPDVLAQNMDRNALRCLWEQAGPDAHLVVLRKEDMNKPCYSLAIVTD